MERTEKFQNMNIEINNPINTANQDANNISASKKAQNEEPISKLGQKFNEFIFTPIESFLLNKKCLMDSNLNQRKIFSKV